MSETLLQYQPGIQRLRRDNRKMVERLRGERFRVSDKILFSVYQPAKCGVEDTV